jgi:hypothetical protein
MSDVTVLIAKHAKLSLGIMNSMCVFQFRLLSICRPRNVVVSTSVAVSSYPIYLFMVT